MVGINDPAAQDAIVALLATLGRDSDFERKEAVLRKFPPDERVFMLIEKLTRLHRMELQNAREEAQCQDCGLGQTTPHTQHPLSERDRKLMAVGQELAILPELLDSAMDMYFKQLGIQRRDEVDSLWGNLDSSVKQSWVNWARAKELYQNQELLEGLALMPWDSLTSAQKQKWYDRVTAPKPRDALGAKSKALRWRLARQHFEQERPHGLWNFLPPSVRQHWYDQITDRDVRAHKAAEKAKKAPAPQTAAGTEKARDAYAHARIDALQREVAYQLAQSSVQGMLVDREDEQQRRFDRLLATFKDADEYAKRGKVMRAQTEVSS